jgi:hypothetical protein
MMAIMSKKRVTRAKSVSPPVLTAANTSIAAPPGAAVKSDEPSLPSDNFDHKRRAAYLHWVGATAVIGQSRRRGRRFGRLLRKIWLAVFE